jgi:hypothetical protein
VIATHGRTFFRAAACLALFSFAACTGINAPRTRPDLTPWPEIRTDYHVEALKGHLQEYSVTFAADVDLAADAIARQTTDPAVRRNALVWRLRAIPEMRKACFRPGPLVGLLDAWILARQMDQLFTTGAGKDAFGALQPEAVKVSHRAVEAMRDIATSITVSPDARTELERNLVDPWTAGHPLEDLTFARESPIARFAELAPGRGDVFQSVGTMEDLVSDLTQQARLYLADLPRHIREEMDLLLADLLPPDSVASMQGDLHTSAMAVDRIATTTDGVPALVRSERQAVLDDLNRQRELVVSAISLESERDLGTLTAAITSERGQLVRDLDAQRLATEIWATNERRETVAQLRQELDRAAGALQRERVAALTDVRQIVDLVLLRMVLFVVGAIVLAPIVAHAYVRVWPRQWRGK